LLGCGLGNIGKKQGDEAVEHMIESGQFKILCKIIALLWLGGSGWRIAIVARRERLRPWFVLLALVGMSVFVWITFLAIAVVFA
jgi:hypothetical protein